MKSASRDREEVKTLFEKLRLSFLIQHPKLDGSDISRFLNEIGRACHDNVVEARAFEKRMSEQYIKPLKRRLWKWIWEATKRRFSSAHRGRWGDDDLYD
jgi:hypothetical protein